MTERALYPGRGFPERRLFEDSQPPATEKLGQLEFLLAAATVFFVPMNFLRYPAFYVTLSDVLAAACLVVMLANRSVNLKFLRRATLFWIAGVSLVCIGLFASSVVNGDIIRGLIVSGQYYYAFIIIPLVVVGRKNSEIIALVKIFVLSIVLMCLHGIYLIHIDGQTDTAFVSGSGRLRGFVERTNECGTLIALTFPLLLWLAAAHQIRRWLGWVAIPILLYGVMLTGSNSALLATAYGLTAFFIATNRWPRIVVVGAATAFVVTSVLTWAKAYLPAVFQRRVLTVLESGDLGDAGTFSGRMELIREALGMADQTTLLGLGADEYQNVSALGAPVHNLYLLIWTEGGLVALVGILLVLLAGFVSMSGALRAEAGKLASTCTFVSVTLFAALINAVPHIYGRFWVVPLLLGIAPSVARSSEGSARLLGAPKRTGWTRNTTDLAV